MVQTHDICRARLPLRSADSKQAMNSFSIPFQPASHMQMGVNASDARTRHDKPAGEQRAHREDVCVVGSCIGSRRKEAGTQNAEK